MDIQIMTSKILNGGQRKSTEFWGQNCDQGYQLQANHKRRTYYRATKNKKQGIKTHQERKII